VQVNKLLPFPSDAEDPTPHELPQYQNASETAVGTASTPTAAQTVVSAIEHHVERHKHDAVSPAHASAGAAKYGVEHTVHVAPPSRFGSQARAPKGHITAIVDPEVGDDCAVHFYCLWCGARTALCDGHTREHRADGGYPRIRANCTLIPVAT
jgi:hypothetical protein